MRAQRECGSAPCDAARRALAGRPARSGDVVRAEEVMRKLFEGDWARGEENMTAGCDVTDDECGRDDDPGGMCARIGDGDTGPGGDVPEWRRSGGPTGYCSCAYERIICSRGDRMTWCWCS